MGKGFILRSRRGIFFILLAGLTLLSPAFALAADTVCARVKIEIKQELTLERQAFDAHMRITNGLSGITLDNVGVDVSFADADGNVVPASADTNNTDALFFIRLDSMENISDVGGGGTVGPSSTADIHWLIIPAPGASNGLESGTLYYVGARLTYTLGGEEKITEVTPDYIYVKPMPEVTLDYFLPSDVYGDDPLTESTVELIVPFSLGVRVKNSGQGVARNLKIESAQPKITENKQGLLIGFAIEGSEVNGRPATDSLLADFGDIAVGSSGVARWIMTCTLSGKFVSFTADFSHSDELGGKLTSLIQAANTHFLVKDVIVDLPGRDAVRDFLAQDGSVYRIYESEDAGLGDPEVSDQSSTAVLSGSGDTRTLTTAVTAGFMYVQLSDPFGGQKVLKEVVRSDGKIIKSDNVWLSHTRVKNSPWQYHLNLFDVNSPGTYTLKFEDASAVPLPPTLQYIADKTVLEGEQVSFIVEAGDPNGTVPALSAAPLPVGATFVDQGSGRGVFDWTPAEGQAGVYEIIYRASDGHLEATRRATIAVKGFRDEDGDDLDDEWELQNFGSLERDGSGDFDHDGVSDLEEFLAETDPAGLAELMIHQTVNSINPSVGDEVILTVTATNNGPRDATGVEIMDLLSGGLQYKDDDSDGAYNYVSGIWDLSSLPALAPGQTATLNIKAEVKRSGKILNVAALTASDLYDPDRSDNSAALLFNGGSQSDLALALTSDNLTPQAGDTVAVALTVTNNGSDDATGVAIDALLPAELAYANSTASQGDYDSDTGIWDVGDLASGAGAQLLLTLTAGTIDEMVLTAALTAFDQADPDPTNNRSSIVINPDPEVHPYLADLALHKRVNHSAVDVGGQAVFTLLVRNNGPHDAGNIAIDDLLPEGLTLQSAIPSQGNYDDGSQRWQAGVIAAGALAMMDMIVAVRQAGAQDNTAGIIDLDEFDPDGGNNSATVGVTGLAADIAVTQSVAPAAARVGENSVFFVTVTNNGPNDANGVHVSDQLPPGLSHQASGTSQGTYAPDTGDWEIGDLSTGQSVTLQITAVVEQSGDMTSAAVKTASSPTDLNPDNDSAAATVTGYAPPVVGDIPGQTIDEGELFLFIDLDDYVNDADNAPAEMDWTYSGAIELSVAIEDGTHVAVITIPHPDWYGSETITFTATDPAQLSDSSAAVFTVRNVNDPPVALVDTYDVDEDQILAVAAPGVLGNDSDIDSIGVTAVLVEAVNSGTLILNSNGSFSYEPNGNFHGNDAFSYKVSDGSDESGVVVVTLVVNPVNDAPIADAGGPYASQEATPITFDASASSDIDNDQLQYRWDFNSDGLWDTEYATAPGAAYTWYDDYTGTVTVEVWDGNITQTATASVTVTDVSPAVTIAGPATVDEGAVYRLALSAVDPGNDTIASWTINWGDGAAETITGNPDTASHTYTDDGDYTISASATNEDGTYDAQANILVSVKNVVPTATAGADQTVDEGDQVSFSGSFTDPGTDTHTLEWNFGDGKTVSGTLTPSHSYGDNGTYTVTLTVTDDENGAGTSSLTVVVGNSAPVLSSLTSNSPSNGEIELTAALADAGWLDTHMGVCDFGDGTVTGAHIAAEHEKPDATGTLTAAHTYAAEGMYTVSVTVSDDDGAGSEPGSIAVMIDKTPPVIEVFKPQAGDYRNTDEIKVDVAVEDPESGGVSSGLVAAGVTVSLDGRPIAADELLDLSELTDGVHILYVGASDYAGNSAAKEVSFEVRPVPALVYIDPHNWNLEWLDPFDIQDGDLSKDTIKAQISLENVEVETTIPTDKAAKLKPGDGYGDFVLVDVVAAQTGVKPDKEKVVSLTLKYVGVDEMDILAFSGDTVQGFYSINTNDLIVIDGSEAGYLASRTVLSSYQSDPPLISAADIIPQTVLLNGQVPIIAGSAQLIVKDAAALAQSGVIAEPPYGIAKEKKHHVWLANVGQPQQMTLEVGSRTIFADEPYPVDWQDWFSLDDDGQLQMMRIHASGKDNLLQVLHHNLQAEARIYLDGALALTILPDTKLVVMEVLFNRLDVMSTLSREDLERGGDWLVTTHNGATLEGKDPRKHLKIADIGHPEKAKLVIGDTVVFDDEPFPINWSERYLIVDGQRQDVSIKTHGANGNDPRLEINCKKLTREARVYLDDVLVLVISPPPEVKVSITGELELDGNPATFDGSFRGLDNVEVKGKLPDDYLPGYTYQRLNTSGEPALQISDRIGEFEVIAFTEGYQAYRVTDIGFSYDGASAAEVKVYADSHRNLLIDSYPVLPGDDFLLDVHNFDGDRVYLEIGPDHADIDLTGDKAAAAGDRILDCLVFETFEAPLGPPHYYFELTLKYVGATDPIALTAYDGNWQELIGTYAVDAAIDPVFTIDGKQLPQGHLGELLVLEYAPVE